MSKRGFVSSIFCAACWLGISILTAGAQTPERPKAIGTELAPQAEHARKADDIPPALTHYMGRELAQPMTYEEAPWLVRESREREENPATLLRILDVKPGQTVCDMGCGNGFYTFKLAALVGPKGKVLAVDIQPEMLHLLELEAKKSELTNVTPILGTVIDPRLPQRSLDLVVLVDVYHEFSHPEHMLQALRRALKPSGRLALVEFRAEDPKVPIRELHKMTKRQMLKELEANGFRLVSQFDELPWQHVMFFEAVRKSGEAAVPGSANPTPRVRNVPVESIVR